MSDAPDAAPATLLLVEDNPGDVRLIEMGFEEGYPDAELHVTTNGEEALEFLRRRRRYESAPRPDLVLLDLNLPKVNGVRVLEEVNADAELRSIPVVVLTSSQSEDDRVTSRERGAVGYFTKPIDPAGFVSLAETIEEFVTAGRLPAHNDFRSDADEG